MQKPKLKWTAGEIWEFLEAEFPQALAAGYKLERLEPRRAAVRLPVNTEHLRPGGSVSGPALMGLAQPPRRQSRGGDLGRPRARRGHAGPLPPRPPAARVGDLAILAEETATFAGFDIRPTA
jgi:hypothetical protein